MLAGSVIRVLVVFFTAIMAVTLPAAGQEGKRHRVAVLLPFSTQEAQPYREAFFAGMRDLGYVDGRNVIFDVRTSDRDRGNVPALLTELLGGNPDVLVSEAMRYRRFARKLHPSQSFWPSPAISWVRDSRTVWGVQA